MGDTTSKTDFLDNQSRILKNFGPIAPEQTKRSPGANRQNAGIVALRIDDVSASTLSGWSAAIPGTMWYPPSELHATVDVWGADKGSEGKEAEVLHSHLGSQFGPQIRELTKVFEVVLADFGPVPLGLIDVLSNQDSVIGATQQLTDEAWELRAILLAAAKEAGLILEGAWGLNLTMLRYLGGLSEVELEVVRKKFAIRPQVSPKVVGVSIGYLVVNDDSFHLEGTTIPLKEA